ncbi:acyl carrier protein [Rhizobium sp. P32RR-XVIII]|uniref:phosphopantetheine-binding protein n=1 Tax=Rhizobium sp. P32RR-XVIII TaxID=2726738 RepID=UPI0014565A52|nr:phosphopantetheine-binding protein [Rhizobium sp. P32RR-XVIII]NLS08358.1 acyl carrier protein [Rhizobium sp. P32RR-XVIII]
MSNIEKIRTQVEFLAAARGRSASGLDEDAILPETGLLDSAAIIELICWIEMEFSLDLPEEEITLKNFGTIKRIAAYVNRNGSDR